MGQIYQMSPELANRIAAGEVVERPGSVIKELVENAIDAKAKHIVVELRAGGVSYIRVTDDGSGILPEDVRTAFLPHATSKIRRESDLDAIGTLGFRGEALAAIASVSRVDVFTRTRAQNEGVQITLEGGKETAYGETGCPVGTTVVVRDLFYNVPARAKFLKKDTTEAAFAEGLVAQIAIARPDIAFRLIRDRRESFSTSGDGEMLNAICACGGRELAGSLLSISGKMGEISISGYVSPPEMHRATRAQQNFYINGRFVRSRILSAALEEAYKGKLMTGRKPLCYLTMQTSLSSVDVNVHPSKMEVKFSREREVASALYQSVIAALEANGRLPELKKHPAALSVREDHVKDGQMEITVQRSANGIYTFPEMRRMGLSDSAVPGQEMKILKKPEIPSPGLTESHSFTMDHRQPDEPSKPSVAAGKTVVDIPDLLSSIPPKTPEKLPEKMPEAPDKTPEDKAISPQSTMTQSPASGRKTPSVRVLGEAFHTYILAEDADGLWLIDKHAAHEKLLFDKLRNRQDGQASQLLLTPKAVSLSAAEAEVCIRHQALLEKAGFALEEFGRGTLLVREAPMYLDEQDIPYVLSDMAARLASFRGNENELLEELLKSVACKAAVKAGMHSELPELQAFAQQVLSNDSLRNCPHGRPCITYLSRYQLEKLFKRVL